MLKPPVFVCHIRAINISFILEFRFRYERVERSNIKVLCLFLAHCPRFWSPRARHHIQSHSRSSGFRSFSLNLPRIFLLLQSSSFSTDIHFSVLVSGIIWRSDLASMIDSAVSMASGVRLLFYRKEMQSRKPVLRSVWFVLIREEKLTENGYTPSSTVPLLS